MNLKEIRSKAIEMISTGEVRADAELSESPFADYDWGDYHLRFSEAKDFLALECFELNNEPEFEELFNELIPEPDLLTKKSQIFAPFEDNEDARARLLASEQILGESCAETGIAQTIWLRHPRPARTIMSLIDQETDLEVRLNLVRALGRIHRRYFRNQSVYDFMISLLDHEHSEMSAAVIASIDIREDERAWRFILEHIGRNPSSEFVTFATSAIRGIPRQYFEPAYRSFFDYYFLQKKLNRKLKYGLVKAMLHTITNKQLADFKDKFQHEMEVVNYCAKYSANDFAKNAFNIASETKK